MPRFRWRRHTRGVLHLPGRAPRPDPINRDHLVAGCRGRALQFKAGPQGVDGILDTSDPWEIEAIQGTIPWSRKELTVDGGKLPSAPTPVAVMRGGTLEAALQAPLPYFEEPESLFDLLAVL
jgi:hypothetical protein